MSGSRIQELIDEIAKDPTDERVGRLANDLLHAIVRGGSIEDVRPLLSSADPPMVSIGVWLASEMGTAAAPLLDMIVSQLQSPFGDIRFEAISCLLSNHETVSIQNLSQVLRLLEDSERSVRWKAMDFLVRLPSHYLPRLLAEMGMHGGITQHERGLRWLLSESGNSPPSVESMLGDPDPLMRRYALVGAVRVAKAAKDRAPLERALTVDDSDIKSYAKTALNPKLRLI